MLRVDAVVGMGRYTNDSNGLELDYEQINDHIAADKVEAAEGAFYPTSFRAADERRSQFARASVDVLDRYVVAATIRRDGTDKFSRERNMPISLQYHWPGNYLTSRL